MRDRPGYIPVPAAFAMIGWRRNTDTQIGSLMSGRCQKSQIITDQFPARIIHIGNLVDDRLYIW